MSATKSATKGNGVRAASVRTLTSEQPPAAIVGNLALDSARADEVGPNGRFARLVRQQLQLLGEDPERDGLVKTPERVAESLAWLTRGYDLDPAEVVGDAVFEEAHESMILVRDIEMYPKPRRQPFAFWIGGHNMEAVERTARVGTGWLPGWRPWPELAERIKVLKVRAAELGRDPAEIEIAPQFSVTIAKTVEEAEKRYMASGLVAHRKSLAYTGRDLSQQVVANLVGSPDLIREKVEGLRKIGVDHACALMIPADSMAEFEDQVEWFAKTVM